jgi:hypothetical protein
VRRLAFVLIVVLGLTPGLYWREALPPPNHSPVVRAEQIVGTGGQLGGPEGPVVEGVWHLTSANDSFGSWSALLAPGDGSLLALSDRGDYLRLPHPPGPGTSEIAGEFGELFPHLGNDKPAQDVESATRDPASGRVWLGLEGRNAIDRMDAALRPIGEARPPEMQGWPANGGPESLLRLADGRFLVLSEDPVPPVGGASMGLMFPGDPVDGARPETFAFAPPSGLYPSDMTELPDGRVLVLARGVALLPPHCSVSLLLADPAAIRPGERWPWRLVAKIDGRAVPYENYEGIAVTGGADGGPVTIWMICDDNQSLLLQRTLLVKLRWQPPPKT